MATTSRLTQKMKDHIDAGTAYPDNEGEELISERLERMIDEAAEIVEADIQDGAVSIDKLAEESRENVVVMQIKGIPAPTGADQLNQDVNFKFKVPVDAKIMSASVAFDTAIASGDATNHYKLNLYNGSNEMLASDVSLEAAGLAQWAYSDLACDQNQDVSAGDLINLRVDIVDDGGGGPTNMSGAIGQLIIRYQLR